MKSPVLKTITFPLSHIESCWRTEFAEQESEYESEKERAELRYQAWREETKRAIKKDKPLPTQPHKMPSAPGAEEACADGCDLREASRDSEREPRRCDHCPG